MICENNLIYKGTTPTVRYTFKVVDPANIVAAFLTATQGGNVIFEKDISDMTVGNKLVDWEISQDETLLLNTDKKGIFRMTYKTNDGKRYEACPLVFSVGKTDKGGVI